MSYQLAYFQGRNGSLVVCWAHCPALCSVVGSILLWGFFFFLVKGFLSLQLTWVLTPFPTPPPPPLTHPHPQTIADESTHRGLVCARMHSIARSQKILTLRSWTRGRRQQKHTQHAPSTKMECDYLYGWIKKRSHTQKSHQKWWTPEI